MPLFFHTPRSWQDEHLYTGSTNDLRARLRLHSAGEVTSTLPGRPLELVFYEAYLKQFDPKPREQCLKSTKGRNTLRAMLKAAFGSAGPSPRDWE
jgi:predicted GIY-YIG superfamily endonuclease